MGMSAKEPTVMTLNGKLRLSDKTGKRTVGDFSKWMKVNAKILRRYFGADLFEGSLNIDVSDPPSLQRNLDTGVPPPTFVIPVGELDNGKAMYLGEGRAWKCKLKGAKFPEPIKCWIFRRVNSGVPAGVIEIVACQGLVHAYQLCHGDAVIIDII
jgi:CTP-dependent riboflavin kinase